jgi:hypothetical protein
MSSSRKVAAEPPANSPYWSKSYTEFVMEKELEEAKAAVEECFRRRARRAGLEGTLPVGRPMTEREIDTLVEALGDCTGSRAKRRKEIEEMTIEDMEAEIRETNVVIRKRRRAGTGLLPMPLALLMCLMVSSVEEFTAPTGAMSWRPIHAWSQTPVPTWARKGRSRPWCTVILSRLSRIG